jgi:hypothetical protein
MNQNEPRSKIQGVAGQVKQAISFMAPLGTRNKNLIIIQTQH